MIPYSFERGGRTRTTLLVVAGVWLAGFLLWWRLEAALWIVLVMLLFTLPAIADLVKDTQSGLHLSEKTLTWYTGQRDAKVLLSEIDHVRLDTRLDFSVRAAVVLRAGGKIRIPFEATPPHQAFEDALIAAGVTTKRFHFHLFQ